MVNISVMPCILLIMGAIACCHALLDPKLNFKELVKSTKVRHLPHPPHKPSVAGVKGTSVQSTDSLSTYVVGGMIILVPSNMSEALCLDILYSLLFAQLEGDSDYNRNSQAVHWLSSYASSLADQSWLGTVEPLVDLTVIGSSFTIIDVALQKMKYQINMVESVPAFSKVFSIIKNQPENDRDIEIIANRTTTSTHETTQHFCYVTGNDIMTCFIINLSGVKDASYRPLSHLYQTKEVENKRHAFYQVIFNDKFYAKIRQFVIDKLGKYIWSDIVQLL